jgi:GDPmannose 4,6-dehydratase
MKTALVFGAGGQAGSYMCDFLLAKGYRVYGVTREMKLEENLSQASKHANFILLNCTDVKNWQDVFDSMDCSANEIYNFAGRMFAPASWKEPYDYVGVNGLAVLYMLEAIVQHKLERKVKFFNAGSADMFKKGLLVQDEETDRQPDSPHGVAKLFAEGLVRSYRQKYKMFACTGIFFNMESPRRQKTFFAEKVVSELARIKICIDKGRSFEQLQLGSLNARRDWGLASEYVEAAWLMLQAEEPEDYVIGTGVSRSCRDYVHEVLRALGLFDGFDTYVNAYGVVSNVPDVMHARPNKIKRDLGWEARSKVTQVVEVLVNVELEKQKEELHGQSHIARQS